MSRGAYDATVAHGSVAPGFEPVRDALEATAAERGEAGCAVCACVDSAKVVDLWWGSAGDGPWREDTLVIVMSCTKAAVALCAQILHDRGLLDVDARVVACWPEYGANGKESTRVAHLLNHTAGVLTFPDYGDVLGIDGEGFCDWELVTTHLAAAPPSWQPGTRYRYHSWTFGYLVGEVIRRIDGRTVGRFFAEEVAAPLGLEFYIGAPAAVLPRVAATLAPPPIVPESFPEDVRELVAESQRQFVEARARAKVDPVSIEALPWSSTGLHPDIELDDDLWRLDLVNSPSYRMAEAPSGNGITTARDLARMYALLANGGELDGVRLVSPESIERFTRFDAVDPTAGHALGYSRLPLALHGAGASAFGHAGAGGNLGFADPERRLSFGLVKNRMSNDLETAHELATVVYECLPSSAE